jgi:hypothetical protein
LWRHTKIDRFCLSGQMSTLSAARPAVARCLPLRSRQRGCLYFHDVFSECCSSPTAETPSRE